MTQPPGLNQLTSLWSAGCTKQFMVSNRLQGLVKAKPGGHLSLSQGKYIRDLLAKNNMLEAKPLPSPMVAGPDIYFAVNKVCQFMAKPLEAHWLAVKTQDDLKIPQRHSFMGGLTQMIEGNPLVLVCSLGLISLPEFGISYSSPTIHCDMSTISLAHNPILHARTKHMELDLFFVREKVLQKLLRVVHIPGHLQCADVLTKTLPLIKFEEFRSKL
ncbi:hypothetical protein A2U01_0004154 [Trifolium medium]|uniref:Retrovirus-related Pol polyprotein from transposon RE1 n=1 Tax=Trifolium medium TaxID=97028 RepID=A0A392M897_9FABA|nr:hypothetical protein [Trifolium medium]